MGEAGGEIGLSGDPTVEFRLLGTLEMNVSGTPVAIGGRRIRVVMAMLLLEPRRIVPTERLIRAVWGESPPRTAEAQVHICVSQLRKLLATVTDEDLIRTHTGGYFIDVADDCVDAGRFRATVTAGRGLARVGQLATASEYLRAALDLWRGDAVADVDSDIVQAVALRINEERLTVLQEWLELELDLGRHDQRIGELTALVASYPLREKMHAMLALALYRAGRQAEALATCRQAAKLLRQQHGIDPGVELQDLERAILDNDARLDAAAAPTEATAPRQLPVTPPDFVGRGEVMRLVCGVLAPNKSDSHDALGGAKVVAISGAAGVGKSALAVRAAHQVHDDFPDGQLYAHLRGTDPVPIAAQQVLNRFLRALGVPPEIIPEDLDTLTSYFRSHIADRRILILLDDAASAGQVRPLIPAGPGCALVVTSRRTLPTLPGAHQVRLVEFEPADSLDLLARRIGESRLVAEPDAAAELAEACGHLPLALQIAAARLSAKEHWGVSQLVARLRDERRRLDELTLDDVGVRPSVSASYRTLTPLAARLLALLSMVGNNDFAGWITGPLLGESVETAVEALEELVEARLVEVHLGSGHQTRYRLHDLTRIFAWEKLSEQLSASERSDAQRRLLRCWLFLARDAHRREMRGHYLMLHSDVQPWPLPEDVTDSLLADPIQWFWTEHSNLVSAVRLAAQLMLDDLCWDLAVTSVNLFETRAYYSAWRETHEVALEVARRTSNKRAEAVLRYSRGGLALAKKKLPEAQRDLKTAKTWFSNAGEVHGRGLTLRNLSSIERMLGNYDKALSYAEAALANLRAVGDLVAESITLRIMGQIDLECNRLDAAEQRLRQALDALADAGGRRIMAQTRFRLGEVLLEQGKLREAEQVFHEVLTTTAAIGDLVGKANVLVGLGNFHIVQQQHRQAEATFRDALDAARNAGSRLPEGRALLGLADLALRGGESVSAAAIANNAEEVFQTIGAAAWLTRIQELRRRIVDKDRDAVH